MSEREDLLAELQQRIGYSFRDPTRLRAALTHASAVEAAQLRIGERLEFLGDAVLGLVLSELLIERYSQHDEGRLSKFRAALVSTISFAAKAKELKLDRELTLGKGEEKTGGRDKPSILAAVYEAMMGGIFLDSGYAEVRAIVSRHFAEAIEEVGQLQSTDAKTELQEFCQRVYHATPVYRVVQETGPDHARRFVVEVLLGDWALARGEGGSKRRAEQEAAGRALQRSGSQPQP